MFVKTGMTTFCLIYSEVIPFVRATGGRLNSIVFFVCLLLLLSAEVQIPIFVCKKVKEKVIKIFKLFYSESKRTKPLFFTLIT